MRTIELFAGAGGLAIGVGRAGAYPEIILERDHWCCETLRANRAHRSLGGEAWPEPMETDVRGVDFRINRGRIDLVTGGPPCQPFSLGGRHRAHADDRDMWTEAVRVLRETQPKAFIFENVRGLARRSFADYLSCIHLQLQHPGVKRKTGEDWADHFRRLQRHHTGGGASEYRVIYQVLDAADFGVAQRRHRLVFVGFRRDIRADWSFPAPTHSSEALAWSQREQGGEYWERHRVARRGRVFPRLVERGGAAAGKPWATVRDALAGLPDPTAAEAARWLNHRFQPGARAYPGHTGSPIDQPAKALKAGVHGVPGGENMIRFADGSVRYFTVREAARLQAFPDDWVFHGVWSEAMRQLGNAVPTTLGEVIATSVRTHLDAAR